MSQTAPITATLREVFIIQGMAGPQEVYGVFLSSAMAADFRKWEMDAEALKTSPILTRHAFVTEGPSPRVFLLDGTNGPYQLTTDYTSEERQKEEALRKSGRSKLTVEECLALGIRP
jgi:hypothetical protein